MYGVSDFNAVLVMELQVGALRPLQVPLVKALYVLVHTGAQDAVCLLANQVQPLV